MTRIFGWLAVALLAGAALVMALRNRGTTSDIGVPPPAAADAARATEILADKSRPWWKGHKLDLPTPVTIVYAPPEKMGDFAEPPLGCPVMPVEVARHLLAGGKLDGGHPFAGRPVRLIDMRLRSRHLVEHIPGSLNIPLDRMNEALSKGELAGTDPKTLVIIYGDRFPHFNATLPFRFSGFEAYYSLEGGLSAWKSKGYPVTASAPVAEYLKALDSERVVGNEPAPADPADIGPSALKSLLDQGMKPLIVFVGDETTYKAGHLPGAIRVSLEDLKGRFEKEPKDRLIAVYCGCCEGSAKGLSGQAVEQLRRSGFKNLLHLNGHLKAWRDQGYPLEVE
jgi:rhodanese-related sulfurtransferase